jgi:hypothetical protein
MDLGMQGGVKNGSPLEDEESNLPTVAIPSNGLGETS